MKKSDLLAHDRYDALTILVSFMPVSDLTCIIHSPLGVGMSIEEAFAVIENDFHTDWPDDLLYMVILPRRAEMLGYHPVINQSTVSMEGYFELREHNAHLYWDFKVPYAAPKTIPMVPIPMLFEVQPFSLLGADDSWIYPAVTGKEINFYWHKPQPRLWVRSSLFYGAAIHKNVPPGYNYLIEEIIKEGQYGN